MDKYIFYQTCPLNSILLTVNNNCRLQFWKPEDNSLLNEFQLPSHLSSNITAVKWAWPKKRTVRSKKRAQLLEEIKRVAIGLNNGFIYLYDLNQGELKQLPSEHVDAINALVWNFDNANLYACSNDHYVSIINIEEPTIKKWEADNNAIYAIQICDNSNYLLTASRNVKLWDISTQQVLRTFMGHIEPINSIIVTQSSLTTNNGLKKLTPLKKKLRSNKGKEIESDATETNSQQGDLQFLTSSYQERDIKLWSLKESSEHTITPHAMYNLENNIHNIDAIHFLDSIDITYISAVTKIGKLYLIVSDTSIAHAKPIHPILNVTFKVKIPNKDPLILPIISAKIISCEAIQLQSEQNNVIELKHHVTIHVWYLKPGTNLPQFYSLNCDELKAGENVIFREHDIEDGAHAAKMDAPDSQIKTIVDPKASMTLDSRIREILTSRHGKKKRDEVKNVSEPSAKASNNTSSATPNYIPKADTLVTLITQCLQAGDRMKLWDVLQANNEKVIKETVKRLPLKWICPFLRELSNRMTFAKINELKPTLFWFDSILLQHASFLISTPEIYQDMINVKELLTDRTSVYPKLMQLKGKLGHLIHQTQLLKENEGIDKGAIVEDTNDPALIYYEESDSELDEGVGADMML